MDSERSRFEAWWYGNKASRWDTSNVERRWDEQRSAWEAWSARAAAEVPRELTEAMMRAAVDTSLKFTTLAPMYSTEIRDLWYAMYDAARCRDG